MLFLFLNYLQPTSYFQKLLFSGRSVFPEIETLPKEVVSCLEVDKKFQSSMSQAYDMSWQAVQKGYIGKTATYTGFESLPLVDNYRFVRKYFHPAWVLYIVVFRILSLKNPFKEFDSWLRTRHVKRSQHYLDFIAYPEFDTFESSLLKQHPKVSVIIPTLNRYPVLKDVLNDLEKQDYKNFEVLVVDQSDDFDASFYKSFDLDLQVIRQEEKALWLARNTAIKASKGSLIALSEDDVRVNPDWLHMHIRCLDFFNVQVSAGVFYPEGKQIPRERSYFALASQFATGNAMLYKNVFSQVGLFDRQFEKQRMGDGEFGMRLYLEGIKSVSNPYACCIDVKAPTGGLREMGSWDAFRPSNFFAPRPIPSVLYYYRRYFGNKAACLALLKMVPLSLFSYKLKKNRLFLFLSILLAFFLLPIILFQVWNSWVLASKKIAEGPLIESLK